MRRAHLPVHTCVSTVMGLILLCAGVCFRRFLEDGARDPLGGEQKGPLLLQIGACSLVLPWGLLDAVGGQLILDGR